MKKMGIILGMIVVLFTVYSLKVEYKDKLKINVGTENNAEEVWTSITDENNIVEGSTDKKNPRKIKFGGNITTTKSIVVENGYVEIDGDGHTLGVATPGVNSASHAINEDSPNMIMVYVKGNTANVTLKNLKIIGAKNSAIYNDGYIYVENISVTQTNGDSNQGTIVNMGDMVLKRTSVYNNIGRGGGALYNHGGRCVLDSCSLYNNRTYQYSGGGIYNKGGYSSEAHAYLYINNTFIANNSSYASGGAIMNMANASGASANCYIMNSTLIGNYLENADGESGGIYTSDTTKIINSIIIDNYNTNCSESDLCCNNSDKFTFKYNVYGHMWTKATDVATTNKSVLSTTPKTNMYLSYNNIPIRVNSNGGESKVYSHPDLTEVASDNTGFKIMYSRLKTGEFAETIGVYATYFDYSNIDDIKMSYRASINSDEISLVNGDNGKDGKCVSNYIEDTDNGTRRPYVVGASATYSANSNGSNVVQDSMYAFVEIENKNKGTINVKEEGTRENLYKKGESITIEATPNSGYILQKLIVKDADNIVTEVITNSQYELLVSSDVVVKPVFVKENEINNIEWDKNYDFPSGGIILDCGTKNKPAIINIKDDIVVKNTINIKGGNVVFEGNNHGVSVESIGIAENGQRDASASTYNVFKVGQVESESTQENIIYSKSNVRVQMRNMTVQGGARSAVYNAGELSMKNVKIANSYNIQQGGGVFNEYGYLVMYMCDISNNQAASGGGLHNVYGQVVVDRCAFYKNRVNGGGGGAIQNAYVGANMYINNTLIYDNHTYEIGGGINNLTTCDLYVMNSTITGNTSTASVFTCSGGVGIRNANFYAVNTVCTDNYLITNGTRQALDYSWSATGENNSVGIFNCIHGNFYKSVTKEIADNGKVYDDINVEQGVTGKNIYTKYNDGIPVLINKADFNMSFIPVSKNSIAASNGVYRTYLDYSTLLDDGIVKIAYQDEKNSRLTQLGDAPLGGSPVVEYFEDIEGKQTRQEYVMGASSATNQYYAITFEQTENGGYEGVKIGIYDYEDGAEIVVKSKPSKGYGIVRWEKKDNNGKTENIGNEASIKIKVTGSATYRAVYGKIEDKPIVNFNAQDVDEGKLIGIKIGMKYSIDGGKTWNTVKDITDNLLEGVNETDGIMIYMPGDGLTTADSEIVTLSVKKALVPNVSVVDCTTKKNNNGKIIGVDTTMEYVKKGGTKWIAITKDMLVDGALVDVKSGVYYVRKKANGLTLASDSVEICVGEYEETKKDINESGKIIDKDSNDANKYDETPRTSDISILPWIVILLISGSVISLMSVMRNRAGFKKDTYSN